MNDSLIKSANNTDNLIKIIDNTVDKIVKEYNISSINSPNNHTRLFNNSYFSKFSLEIYFSITCFDFFYCFPMPYLSR